MMFYFGLMQGILREPHFPLSKVADKNKDVMIKACFQRPAQQIACKKDTQTAQIH